MVETSVIMATYKESIECLKQSIESIINQTYNDFEFIIATSEYMFRKPNKRIFDLALEKAGLSAEDVWYIGDQYEADIVGAGNAGLYPVWYLGAIDMNFEKRDDVFTIESWNELKIMMEENR